MGTGSAEAEKTYPRFETAMRGLRALRESRLNDVLGVELGEGVASLWAESGYRLDLFVEMSGPNSEEVAAALRFVTTHLGEPWFERLPWSELPLEGISAAASVDEDLWTQVAASGHRLLLRDTLRWSGWRAPAHLIDTVIDVLWSRPLAQLAVLADAMESGVDDPAGGGWPECIWDQPAELIDMMGDIEALLRDVDEFPEPVLVGLDVVERWARTQVAWQPDRTVGDRFSEVAGLCDEMRRRVVDDSDEPMVRVPHLARIAALQDQAQWWSLWALLDECDSWDANRVTLASALYVDVLANPSFVGLTEREMSMRDVGPAMRWAAGLRRGVSLGDVAAVFEPARYAWLATIDDPCGWFAGQLRCGWGSDAVLVVFRALVRLGVDVEPVLGDVPGTCWAHTPTQLCGSWLEHHLGSGRHGALLAELARDSEVTVAELAASIAELAVVRPPS